MATIKSNNYSSPKNINLKDGILRFDIKKSSNPLASDSAGYGLYVNSSGKPVWWDGSNTTILGAAGAGVINSWEDLFSVDTVMALTTAAWSITQAGNFGNLILTKTGTGAGVPLVINNAGTGNDINIVNTNAEAVGVKISTDAQSQSAADADTILYLSVNGYSDNQTAREYGNLKFIADDTGNGSEDTSITIGAMVAGTSRTVFNLANNLLLVGYGAAATISSQGAYNLVLETNSGTSSGTITITDGAAGEIALAPDTTGVVTVSTGLQTGGVTPTACILNVAGSTGAGTTGYGAKVNATTLTTGTVLLVDSAVSSSGLLLDLQLATSSVFKVSETGALTIAGTGAITIAGAAGANKLVLTAGDVVFSDGSVSITDNDNAAALSIANDTVTTIGAAADAGLVQISSESLSTGAMLNLSCDETALTTGWYFRCWGQDAAASVFSIGEYGATIITTAAVATSLSIVSASTNVDVMSIATTALTTGDALQITSTAETLAAGELLKILNTEDGDLSATPKTGNLCSITSSVTMTTNSTALDYDTLLISRSNIANQATKTLTASGSVLKLMNTSTNTAGTCTDTTVILELLAVDGGTAAPTGDVLKLTSVGVGAKAINITSASTSVSDVLIAGSGVKASAKAVVEITSTGSTAAGGSILRVAHAGTGDPASATSYLAIFSQSAATCASNPVAVYMDGGASTAAALHVIGSGAMAGGSILVENTNGGALGATLKFKHHSATPGDNDVISSLIFAGMDDGGAGEAEVIFSHIDVVATDVSAASEDADLKFYVMRAGTSKLSLAIDSDVNGILIGDGALAGGSIVSSNGAFDLILETNSGTNSGAITITDGANGDIAITPNGTGQVQLTAPTYGQYTAGADGAAVLTVAMCGLYTIPNTVARTLTLPAAATSAGVWYTIKKTTADAAAVTIDGSGAETIDGAATNTEVDAQYDSITIVCDGSNWHIVSKKIAA